jgi:DNA primase catalytic subunit
MLEPHKIQQFYLRGFRPQLEGWPRIWNKQFKILTVQGTFLNLNKFDNRLSTRSLIALSAQHAPVGLYFSVMNWLMPERVGKKSSANKAYPFSGEYVVDIDVPQMWRPWNGHGTNNLYAPGVQIAYDRTVEILDKIRENHSDIRIIFSGKRGFHIHVLDFNLRDWTRYNTRNPIKSHEVARFIYTHYLQSSCGQFGKYHFVLSSDPMRVMTVPGSLNGKTGLVCFEVGCPEEFERLSIEEIVVGSDARKHFYYNGFHTASELVQTHPETTRGG